MKLALPSLFSLLLTAAALRADYVIVQKVEGGMQSGTMTLKIKEDKVRADIAEQVSTITDGATGEVMTLMHAQKNFMKISAAQTKAGLEAMRKLQPQTATTTPPKLTPTGKKEKVGAHDCEVFTWAAPGMTTTLWIAKDFPNAAKINAALAKLQNTGVAAAAAGMLPSPTDYPGMAVKTEMTMAGQKVTSTLVSVTEEAVAAAAFAVPTDYKELPMPAFNLPPAK